MLKLGADRHSKLYKFRSVNQQYCLCSMKNKKKEGTKEAIFKKKTQPTGKIDVSSWQGSISEYSYQKILIPDVKIKKVL